MEKWKARGEVSDSDDEDEDYAASTTPPTASNSGERVTERDDQHNLSSQKSAGVSGRQTRQQIDRGAGSADILETSARTRANDSTPTKNYASARVLSHVAISSPHSPITAYSAHYDEGRSSPPVSQGRCSGGLQSSQRDGIRDKTPPSWDLSSVLSSPLSEREFSPPVPEEFLVHRRPTTQPQESPSQSVSRDFQFPRLGHSQQPQSRPVSSVFSTDTGLHDETPALRAPLEYVRPLRVRKEKQLHPYMIDKLEYQRQCRERGMQPIRLMEQRPSGFETQDNLFDDGDRQSQATSQLLSSSPLQAAHAVRDEPAASNDRFQDLPSTLVTNASSSESDLPEPSAWYNERRATYSHKRRKLLHPRKPSGMALRDGATKPQSGSHSAPTPPPTSSSSTGVKVSEQRTRVFRLPLGMKAATTPPAKQRSNTAELSSNSRYLQLSNKNQPPSQHSPPLSETESEESSNTELPTRPDQGDKRLQRVRREIKGVLPASWLRIDLQTQQKSLPRLMSRKSGQAMASPAQQSPQKGVARVVRTATLGSRPVPRAFVLSDDDGDSGDDDDYDDDGRGVVPPKDLLEHRQQETSNAREPSMPFMDVDDDIMEVDWVDPMLTGVSRPRPATTSKRKKRQCRIEDSMDITRSKSKGFPTVSAGGVRREKIQHNKGHSKRQARKTANIARNHLSILDAPKQANPDGLGDPPFVRLAIRQARRQPNYARHSPSGKHLRLATREDTQDANMVLQQWRDGIIAPSNSYSELQTEYVDLTVSGTNDYTGELTRDPLRTPLADVTNTRRDARYAMSRTKAREQDESAQAKIRRPRWRQVEHSETEPSDRAQAPLRAQRARPIDKSKNKNREHPAKIRSGHRNQAGAQYRNGQLETLEQDFVQEHREVAFKRRIFCLTENVARRAHASVVDDLPLDRYVRQNTRISGAEQTPVSHSEGAPSNRRQTHSKPLAHRNRKRLARRIDAETRGYRQPSEPITQLYETEQAHECSIDPDDGLLHGLWPAGRSYPTTFDITPLQLGTSFHESSFIGSGEFAASLAVTDRQLDVPTGRMRIHVENDVFEWGQWTEEVASQLSRIPQAISAAMDSCRSIPNSTSRDAHMRLVEANVDYLLRSTIRYFSKCLSFIDSIDRNGCIRSIGQVVTELLELLVSYDIGPDYSIPVRCLEYAFVLSYQAYSLSVEAAGLTDGRNDSRGLVLACARRLLQLQSSRFGPELESFYEDNRVAAKREAGIRDSDVAVSSVVLLHHVLHRIDATSSFWDMLWSIQDPESSHLRTVSALDRKWYTIFIVLPVLEIDDLGMLRFGTRLHSTTENVELVKRLLVSLLDLYPATSMRPDLDIDGYLRATLIRCERLSTIWGWWRCEAVLSLVFDFFARRNLSPLQSEKSVDSPNFVGHLDQQLLLETQADEPAFHIFLKMLTSGLLNMRKYRIYSEKKIAGIAWRFIPNHGRTYPKDAQIHQEDIDALRNHHDLLCTLYFASPPDHRLRVGLLQGLVNHLVSHREACRLNVRAWANLAAFQVSTDEPLERLDAFCEWFTEILAATIGQYRLARSEVDQEIASATALGTFSISFDMVEATVAQNQRQILATLIDALASLKRCLLCAKTFGAAMHLLQGTAFWKTFELFDPSTRRLNALFVEALAVVKTALDVESKFCGQAEDSQQSAEDSQDFGDFGALQDFASTQAVRDQAVTVADCLHDALGQLLSNAFGADFPADDSLLTDMIDLWVRLGSKQVQHGKKTWSTYVNAYDSYAWIQFRDTGQKRKFTPYFLQRILDQEHVDLNEMELICHWMRSLLEREALLKYQHLLTAALLNTYPEARLLQNLPMARTHQTGRYDISLQQLRQCRLSAISSFLSNMRRDFDDASRNRKRSMKDIRRAYGDTLQQMMHAMKNNYLEVQACQAGDGADIPAQGAYVEFVQHVVSFLQQYTTVIHPIDEFFTNSAAFPLPATDPTYVVGKLRSYVPKLGDAGTKKQLLSFFQSLCERAAVDRQQRYLVNQMTAAMTGIQEEGNVAAPSLRYTVGTLIFPAYVDNALEFGAAWIPAIPILQAWGNVVQQLLYDVILDDPLSVEAAMHCASAFLASVERPIRSCLCHPGLFELPHVRKLLSAVFDALKSGLTTVQHLSQTYSDDKPLAERISRLVLYAARVERAVTGSTSHEVLEYDFDEPDISPPCPWPDMRGYVYQEVRQSLKLDWTLQDGQYTLQKKNLVKEIIVNLSDEVGERQRLLASLRMFRESVRAVYEYRGWSGGDSVQEQFDTPDLSDIARLVV